MKIANFDPRDPYYYNPIINSNFDFWQRIAGTSITRTQASLSNGYGADRFFSGVLIGGSAKSITIQRSTNVPAGLIVPAAHSHQVVNNTAIASYAATEYLNFVEHGIEGVMIKPFAGSPMILGFWLQSSIAGTYTAAFRRNIVARSYVTTFTVNAPNTWEYKIVNLPWDTGGPAQNYLNSNDLNMLIGGVSGTTYQAPSLNAWNTGNYFSHSSVTNWGATAGATLRIAQIQLRSGSRNLEEMRDGYVPYSLAYDGEFAACRRYYQKSYEADTVPGSITVAGAMILQTVGDSGSNHSFTIVHPTRMRTGPVGAVYNPLNGAINNVQATANNSAHTGATFNGPASCTPTQTGEQNTVFNAFSYSAFAHGRVQAHYTLDADF